MRERKRVEYAKKSDKTCSMAKHKKAGYLKTSSGLKVKIDQEDLERVSQYSWRVTKATTGRLRVVASIPTSKGYKTVTLGKFLMNPPKGKQVYPRRFNETLDYCKENLIVCTLKERQRLLPKKRSENSSKYRGVSYSKGSKKWRAGIQVEGHSINLGEFKSEREAALAYNKAAKKYFGEFAYQNTVTGSNTRRKKKTDQ